MKKLFLGIAFMLCQVLSMAAYDFSSQTYYSIEEGLDSVWVYYSINPDGKSVSVTKGPEVYKFNHLRIPETVTHNDTTYTVTEIAYQAFLDGNIDIVEMANTITKIGDYAFTNCGIDSIKFSTNLKSIGENAFAESSLTSVYFPEGLETIGKSAFVGSTANLYSHPTGKIHTVSFPSTLKEIGEGAFAANANLNNVVIPECITEIKPRTFSTCWTLNNVVLPKNLTKIGNYAFSGCAFVELNADFFPKSLVEIGDYAFNYGIYGRTSSLKKVVLPDNILHIGERCFSSTTLEYIKFSSGMTELPEGVCNNCPKLVDVIIPNSITKIGERAFAGTDLLSHIELPATITEIGGHAFYESGLVTFSFPPLVQEIKPYTFEKCTYLAAVKIPEAIKMIGMRAFYDCKYLVDVEMADVGVETVDDYAFYNCTSLKNLKLSSTITEINEYAFRYNSALEQVILPDSLKTIGPDAFWGCTSLKDIQFKEGLITIGETAFWGCTAIEAVDLPHSLETLGIGAFKSCSSLTKITIPHAVSAFGSENFYGCPNIKEVHYKRAILPSGMTNSSRVIEDGNNCTLYVPIGSKATYEASANWINFDTIVEEEIGYDILYRVSAIKTGQGSVSINDEAKASVDVLSGTKVSVKFAPASGWKLKSVVLNDKDVTSLLVDDVYEIESLEANMVFMVTFEELPANLQLKQADGGYITVPVVKGTKFTCVFAVEDGWEINNVRYNNSNVTSSLTENNEYTTPVIKNDAILSVAYEKQDGAVEASFVDESNVVAYVTVNGVLVVEGVVDGMPVNVIASDGKIVSTLISQDGNATCQLPAQGVYMVKTISKTIKVGY